MKAKYLLAAVSLLAGCAKSPRQQVKDAVKVYLRATAPGYQPGEFMLAAYSRADSASDAKDALLHEMTRKTVEMAGTNSLEETRSVATAHDRITNKLDRLTATHDTTRIGWRVNHFYQANNTAGTPINHAGEFIVYLPATVVVVHE